jgi:hypothetical protein
METLFVRFWLSKIRGTENLSSIQVWGLFIDGRQNQKKQVLTWTNVSNSQKMEIQERILSKKVHSLKEIGNSVLSETNVDDIIDGYLQQI